MTVGSLRVKSDVQLVSSGSLRCRDSKRRRAMAALRGRKTAGPIHYAVGQPQAGAPGRSFDGKEAPQPAVDPVASMARVAQTCRRAQGEAAILCDELPQL